MCIILYNLFLRPFVGMALNNIDNFPELSHTIDIGGDRYFMGTQKPIESGFKNRKHYLNAFGNERETERLLRKYMFYSLKDKKNIVFESQEDKTALLKILKDWVRKTKTNPLYNSPILKNTIIRRSCLNVEQLIQQLENSDNKEFKIPDIDILPCTKAKKYIKEIPDDHKFQMILEIAWYLLHPDGVPEKVRCDWAKLIKQLDTLRLGDIVAEIRKTDTSTEPVKNAFNYFKKINIQAVAKSDSIVNALDQAKKFATEIEDKNATDEVKNRLKLILNILEMKKYLSNELAVDSDGMKIIKTVAESNSIQRSMITNPMRGGNSMKGGDPMRGSNPMRGSGRGADALNKPVGTAMKPLFDYFKGVYDPIYTFLESSIQNYEKENKIIIPQLTTLLHICNNVNSLTGNIYGVYRITNVDSELLQFINTMIQATAEHIAGRADTDKNIFNKQIFKLPKVQLSGPSSNSKSSSPCIQFFTMGTNINLMSKSVLKEDTDKAVKEFYKEGNIYMVCSKLDNIAENIPINVYDIDYTKDTVDIDKLLDNYFNKNIETLKDEVFLENLLDIKPYVVYNDAELALSIFIAFNELMPK